MKVSRSKQTDVIAVIYSVLLSAPELNISQFNPIITFASGPYKTANTRRLLTYKNSALPWLILETVCWEGRQYHINWKPAFLHI